MLRSCLKAAQIDGHLETLPLLGVAMPGSHSRQPTVLTLGEAFEMVAVAPPPWRCRSPPRPITGLRLGDLLALSARTSTCLADASTPGHPDQRQTPHTADPPRGAEEPRRLPPGRDGRALAVLLEAHLDQLGPADPAATAGDQPAGRRLRLVT